MEYIAILVLAMFIYLVSKSGIFAGNTGKLSGTELNSVQDLFFRTVFTLLGYVAKRDGPVNSKEVKRTERFMEKMDLDPQRKREAIRLFKSGADPTFNVQPTINAFKGLAKKSPNLAQILLVYLVNLARVDGALVNKEVEAVEEVASGLGYSSITFQHLLKMISSQNKFSQRLDEEIKSSGGSGAAAAAQKPRDKKPSQNSNESCEEKMRDFQGEKVNLRSAYDVLEISPSVSSADVKKAYRSLVNQYHPDKLIGLGLPPYMVQSATECFKTIQAAYEYIQKSRSR